MDHGELSVLDKHILITNKKPTIIDFESSSLKRKTSNVSSATQAILIGTGLAKTIRRQINIPRRDKIIPANCNIEVLVLNINHEKPIIITGATDAMSVELITIVVRREI